MIARQAGMNIAAIPYYFNGKQGLYHAVVELVTSRLLSRLQEPLLDLEHHLDQKVLSPPEAIELMERFLQALIELMVGSPEAHRFMRIILREQLYPSPAYDLLFNRFMNPLLTVLSRLVALATGTSPSRLTLIRAFSIVGQVVIFRIGRETMVRSLGLEGFSSEETEDIKRIVLEQTRAALENMAGAG
jgi:AcrR family transcriptional regulator